MRRIFIIFTFLLCFSGCGTAPVQPDNTAQTEPSATFTEDAVIAAVSPESEPESGFNPIFGWGAGEHVHEPLIQSTLTVTTPDLKISNDLATEISVSEDALIWNVKLRDDVFFTDGVKLTAKDVAFTYNTAKEQSSVVDFTMLREARALDDTTVEFLMEHPYSAWPYTMSTMGIIPEHAYSDAYGEIPVGSGRYMLKQWDKGQQAIFEANPNYYGETPQIKKLTVLFMTEEAAFLAAQAGQVDLAYTAVPYASQTPKGYELLVCKTVDNRGFNLPTFPADSANMQGLSTGNAVTSDLAVRQAMNIGIDREALIRDVLEGYGSPAYSVCDGMPWQSPYAKVTYDPERAKKLLEDAGWNLGSDGIREKNGVRAAISLLYPTGDSVRQTLSVALSAQLKMIGIAAEVEGVSWDSAYSRALSQPLAWGWGAHTPMELYNLHHTAADGSSARYTPYANKTVDAAMDAALQSRTQEEAYVLWQKAQWDGKTGIADDVPWLWMVNIDHLFWVRSGLQPAEQKIQPHGHGWSILNNIDQWSWAD